MMVTMALGIVIVFGIGNAIFAAKDKNVSGVLGWAVAALMANVCLLLIR